MAGLGSTLDAINSSQKAKQKTRAQKMAEYND